MGVVYEARMALPLGGELPVALKVLRADVMRCGVGVTHAASAGRLVASRSLGPRPAGVPTEGAQSPRSAGAAGGADSLGSGDSGGAAADERESARLTATPAQPGAGRARETEPLHGSGGCDRDIDRDARDALGDALTSPGPSLGRRSGGGLSGVLSTDLQYSRLLMREAVTAMRFNHNHINLATAYDFGISTAGGCFLVMEFVDGPSLRSLRRLPRMPYPNIRRIAVDILDGLSFLHGNGVLHRDISSGNILLSRGGPAKLVDFGLAKQIESTHSGVVRGTVAYASPEALQGSRLDARSDLYSLAAVLYELIAGQPPYGSDEPVPTYINMLRTEPDALPSDAPSDLRALVLGLLALEPSERRFATALDALEFLCEHGEQVADDHEMGAFLSGCLGSASSVAPASSSADAAPLDHAPLDHDEAAIADTILWIEHDPSAESEVFGGGGSEGSVEGGGSLFDGASRFGHGAGLLAEAEPLGIVDAVVDREALAVGSGSDHGAAGASAGVAEMFVKGSREAVLEAVLDVGAQSGPLKPRCRKRQLPWVMLLLCVAGVLGTSSAARRGDSSDDAAVLASASAAPHAAVALATAVTAFTDSRCTSPWAGMFWATACRSGAVTTVAAEVASLGLASVAADDIASSRLASVDVETSGAFPTLEVDESAKRTVLSPEPPQLEAQELVGDGGDGDEPDTQPGGALRPQGVRQPARAAKPSSYSIPNFVKISIWTVEDRTVEDPGQP
ncbi:MAG: hypothetical protein Tsb0020_02230 [Haliangiales bacterium]